MAIPSKTFIVGEYIALNGGPTLLLNSAPAFRCHITHVSHTSPSIPRRISPLSPAGVWIKKHAPFFSHTHIHFDDPHHHKGGFGASSAHFISVWLAQHCLSSPLTPLPSPSPHTAWKIREQFRQCAHNPVSTGPLPSGMDVMGQYLGNIAVIHAEKKQAYATHWPFPTLAFVLLHTGKKINTHTHLSCLSPHLLRGKMDTLSHIASRSIAYFQQAKQNHFLHAVQQYADTLEKYGWVTPHTQQLLLKIADCRYVKAAKGCGSLGGDVILILIDYQHTDTLIDHIHHINASQKEKMTLVYHGNAPLSLKCGMHTPEHTPEHTQEKPPYRPE